MHFLASRHSASDASGRLGQYTRSMTTEPTADSPTDLKPPAGQIDEAPRHAPATKPQAGTSQVAAAEDGTTLPPLDLRPGSLTANLGRGFLMGGADIIPGVSGGTVALILGIYTRLISAIGRVGPDLLADVRTRSLTTAARRLDLSLTAPLFVGILLGAVSLGSIVDTLLRDYRQYTLGLFFGLIAASAVYVAKLVPRWSPAAIGASVIGAVAAFLLVGLPALANPPNGVWYLFVCGAIGICAMILPGVSGAFLLLVLGRYDTITGIIKNVVKLDLTSENLVALAVFGSGCVVGLLSFARVLSRLLKSAPSITLATLCGLMVGSLRKLWPFQVSLPEGTDEHPLYANRAWNDVPIDSAFWVTCGLAILGITIVFVLDFVSPDDSDHDTLQSEATTTGKPL